MDGRDAVRLIVAAGFAAFAGMGLAFAQGSVPAGDPRVGRALFMRDGCYECHGTVGEGSGQRGSGGWGPMLAPRPIPFDAVLAQLRRPRDEMPAYSAINLSDEDAANIYAYLLSIPIGKAASDISLLAALVPRGGPQTHLGSASVSSGETVYTANCSSCHGAQGTGQPDVFPPLAHNPIVTGSPETLVRIVNDGVTSEITVNGSKYHGTMPGWKGTLTSEQIAGVITYIRAAWGNGASAVTPADVSAVK
jgi:ubiquinol-cytochrome c reductase cytochrome c subunit